MLSKVVTTGMKDPVNDTPGTRYDVPVGRFVVRVRRFRVKNKIRDHQPRTAEFGVKISVMAARR